mgnify:CR=1 FL=1
MNGTATTADPIPMLELRGQLAALGPALEEAARRVLRSGQYILGPEVEAFEQEVAAYLGAPYAVAVNSGTDALVIGLRALGIGPGDEVLTTPFTFFATAEAIALVGARPVFVDIDPASFLLDLDRLETARTPRTRAVVPVHLYGRPVPMEPLLAFAQAHGLRVLEDVAQAFGARHRGRALGTWGDAGAFSFYPTKNLGGFGDGGLLVTADPAVADRARALRAHGAGRDRYAHETLGYNSRLDALQAALLRVKLPHVDRWNAERRAAAAGYHARLADLPGVVLPTIDEEHVVHQYTVRILDGRRDAVRQALAADGIATMVYYPTPLHRLPPFRALGAHAPAADRAAAEVLSLPLWPGIPEATQDRVADALARALAG